MVRINLEVTEEKKARWDEYVENEWEGSLSSLVRHSVEREIAGRDEGPVAPAVDVDMSGLENLLRTIEDRLDGVDARLEVLAGDDGADRVAGRVSEWLPTARPGTGGWEDQLAEIRTGAVPDPVPTDDPSVAELAWQGTAGGLAQVSGYPEELVRDALGLLEREIHVVHSVEHAGATRYYKGAVR